MTCSTCIEQSQSALLAAPAAFAASSKTLQLQCVAKEQHVFQWLLMLPAAKAQPTTAFFACMLLLLTASPTAQLPCFTASIAYSTWNSRPWGLQVVTSVSYCGSTSRDRLQVLGSQHNSYGSNSNHPTPGS
jgi:hypothetical protein